MSSQLIAVVLAAGYSSRMSALKSLYPIGNELMVERTIRILKEDGIKHIHIVTGHKSELLERLLSREPYNHDVNLVHNADYKNGMFSSVLAGVKSLPSDVEGFLMLPIDYPFVAAETITKIVKAFKKTNADIVSPLCGGIEGHPPAIRNTVFNDIINDTEIKGLGNILRRKKFSSLKIETNDEGILFDIDDDESYQRLLKRFGIESNYPLPEQCDQICKDLNIDLRITMHMAKVKEVAVSMGENLNSAGGRLNLGLLSAAAGLHDICKGEPDHAVAAGRYFNGLGYPEVAAIVSQHMNIDFNENSVIDEAAVLYLADKMVEGDCLSDLNLRMKNKLEEYKGNAGAEKNIAGRFEKAFLIRRKIDEIIKKAEADT